MTTQDRTRTLGELLGRLEPHLRSIGFFADMFEAAEIPEGQFGADTIQRVAPVHKNVLRSTPWRKRCHQTERGGMILGSSGTTGAPTLYKWTTEDLVHVGAVTEVFRRALGVTGDDIGAVWAPIDRSVMGQCMVHEFLSDGIDVHVLGAVDPPSAFELLSGSGATVMKGLPRAALGLGMTLADRELSLRQVHVGGDLLSDRIRSAIEMSVGCECYNFYGLSEVWGPLAAECNRKDGLHYLSDQVLIEILDPLTGAPCADGEIGVACFTTLWEKCSPVLRYWSGDLVQRIAEPCKCGSLLPRIVHHGRLGGYDYLRHRPLSLLQVDSIVGRHAEGLLDFNLVLEDETSQLTVFAHGDVDDISLADELGSYLQKQPTIHAKPPSEAVGGSKWQSIADLRTRELPES